MAKSFFRHQKFYTGVSLDPEVLEYLDDLVSQTRWSRSLVLNTIIREHARLMTKKGIKGLFEKAGDAIIF